MNIKGNLDKNLLLQTKQQVNFKISDIDEKCKFILNKLKKYSIYTVICNTLKSFSVSLMITILPTDPILNSFSGF